MNFQFIRGFLKTAYKTSDGDIDAILTGDNVTEESVQAAILEIHKTFQANRDKTTYQRGERETMERFEKKLRTDFNLDSDAKGIDLVKALLETQKPASEEGENKPGPLTDDAVKAHPVYIQAMDAAKAAAKKAEKEAAERYAQLEGSIKRDKIMGTVNTKALALLAGMNPITESNAKIAANRQKAFLSELSQFEYEELADGRIVMKRDGKVYEDEYGHPVVFDDHVKSLAGDYYEFSQNNGGDNAGNRTDNKKPANGTDAKGYPVGIERPTDDASLSKILNDPNIDDAKKLQVYEAFAAENKG